MIRCTDENMLSRVFEYIGDGKYQCFYLYLDLQKYGTTGENVELWLSYKDSNINGIAYRYYDTLHLYSKEQLPSQDVLHLVEIMHPMCITGPDELIAGLRQFLDTDYSYKLSHIITTDHLLDEVQDVNIAQACEADLSAVVELLMSEHIYSSVYDKESLLKQLKTRLNDGFGRIFVARDSSGRLIATNATFAENDEIAVIGGLVTDPSLRGKGFGRAITASTWNLLFRGGKRCLAFLADDNEPTLILHRKMGFEFIGKYARLLYKTQ